MKSSMHTNATSLRWVVFCSLVAMLSSCKTLQKTPKAAQFRNYPVVAHSSAPAVYGEDYELGEPFKEEDLPKASPSQILENISSEMGLIIADRISCPVALTGNRYKSDAIVWHIMNALSAYHNALVGMKKDKLLESDQFLINRTLLEKSFLERMGNRIGWQLHENTTPFAFSRDLSKVMQQMALRVQDGDVDEFESAEAFLSGHPLKGELGSLATRIHNINDLYRGSVAKPNLCRSFEQLGAHRWSRPRFDAYGNAAWRADKVATNPSFFGPKLVDEAKLPRVSENDPSLIRDDFELGPAPSVQDPEERAEIAKLQEESKTIDPPAYKASEELYPQRTELDGSRLPSKVGVAPKHMRAGLMPGATHVDISHGGTFNPRYKNRLIVTHMTAGSGCQATTAHFTICRDGRVMQHIPITHRSTYGSKGNNSWTINVEFVAAYTTGPEGREDQRTSSGRFRDLSKAEGGGKGHHYEVMTAEQIEMGARVYAFVSQQTGIPLERVTDGKNPWNGGGKQATGYYAGTRSPRESGVANHREVNPYTKGIAAHHSDFMREQQHQQMLNRAREILHEATQKQMTVALNKQK